MFIGRKNELNFLEECYQNKQGQLIVLYGRRRVGKTETLREFCKNKPHVFFSCTQTTDKVQLEKFSQVMFQFDLPIKRYSNQFNDWESAFLSILDLPFQGKKLVVLDEFPYCCNANHAIPSILQNIWDIYMKDADVMIILCGSALSFIENELLAEKNPLYGRANGIYKMNELGFQDAVQFFPHYSNEDKILAFSILGGMPHYLKQFDPDHSIEENIKRKILTKGSVLYSEVEFMLHQELRETMTYNAIIEAVASGATKLNEVSQKSLLNDTTRTNVYLQNLIRIGIMKKEYSLDIKTKEKGNANRGIYQLNDHFFRFWYAFAFPHYSALEDGDVDGLYEYVIKPQLNEFASLSFEDICLDFIKQKQKTNQLPFRYVKIGKWMGQSAIHDSKAKNKTRIAETEIDILAIDQKAKNMLIGECKYKNKLFTYGEYLNTKAKTENFEANIYIALFSKSGFDEKILDEAKDNDHLLLFNLQDVVHPN